MCVYTVYAFFYSDFENTKWNSSNLFKSFCRSAIMLRVIGCVFVVPVPIVIYYHSAIVSIWMNCCWKTSLSTNYFGWKAGKSKRRCSILFITHLWNAVYIYEPCTIQFRFTSRDSELCSAIRSWVMTGGILLGNRNKRHCRISFFSFVFLLRKT